MSARAPALLFLGLWALACCGGAPSRLEGSISSEADLAFDEVRAEWLLDELAVRYVVVGASLCSDAARLTVRGPLAIAGNELDAAKDVRVEHFRYFWDDEGHLVTTTPFPAVDHGTLEFDEVGKKLGERVVGRFTVVFVTGDTLGGEFDAPVVEPDPDR